MSGNGQDFSINQRSTAFIAQVSTVADLLVSTAVD